MVLCFADSQIAVDNFTVIGLTHGRIDAVSGEFSITGNVSLADSLVPEDVVSKRTLGLLGHHPTFHMYGGSCRLSPNHHHSPNNFGHPVSGSSSSVLNQIINGFSHSCNLAFGHHHDHSVHFI